MVLFGFKHGDLSYMIVHIEIYGIFITFSEESLQFREKNYPKINYITVSFCSNA